MHGEHGDSGHIMGCMCDGACTGTGIDRCPCMCPLLACVWLLQLGLTLRRKGLQHLAGSVPSWVALGEHEKVEVRDSIMPPSVDCFLITY